MRRPVAGVAGTNARSLFLAGTTLLGFAAVAPDARATPFDFTYTGSLVTFTVPTTDTYQILAYGAQGGNVDGSTGGLGAEIGGDFSLTAGETLEIAVGGAGLSGGNHQSGGGGGGTFIIGPGNTALVIAGGGGGAGTHINGGDGETSLNGGDGGAGGGVGGTTFFGGAAGLPGGGGGGGGFLGSGDDAPEFGIGGDGGGSFPGLAGGSGFESGGFGGGGGGGASGGGGGAGPGTGGGGGGGGSFDAGFDQILVADFQPGNGEVVISAVPIPEPASIALLGAGLLSFAMMRRRCRPRA